MRKETFSADDYESIGQDIVSIIYGLIDNNPEILQITDPSGLFQIEEFNNALEAAGFIRRNACSRAQANAALSIAKGRWMQEHPQS
jgi:hypothetical protein